MNLKFEIAVLIFRKVMKLNALNIYKYFLEYYQKHI